MRAVQSAASEPITTEAAPSAQLSQQPQHATVAEELPQPMVVDASEAQPVDAIQATQQPTKAAISTPEDALAAIAAAAAAAGLGNHHGIVCVKVTRTPRPTRDEAGADVLPTSSSQGQVRSTRAGDDMVTVFKEGMEVAADVVAIEGNGALEQLQPVVSSVKGLYPGDQHQPAIKDGEATMVQTTVPSAKQRFRRPAPALAPAIHPATNTQPKPDLQQVTQPHTVTAQVSATQASTLPAAPPAPAARVLVLTGARGSGKSAVALEVAHTVLEGDSGDNSSSTSNSDSSTGSGQSSSTTQQGQKHTGASAGVQATTTTAYPRWQAAYYADLQSATTLDAACSILLSSVGAVLPAPPLGGWAAALMSWVRQAQEPVGGEATAPHFSHDRHAAPAGFKFSITEMPGGRDMPASEGTTTTTTTTNNNNITTSASTMPGGSASAPAAGAHAPHVPWGILVDNADSLPEHQMAALLKVGWEHWDCLDHWWHST
jgi:hypothetical protein